jgi:hypothetical protein
MIGTLYRYPHPYDSTRFIYVGQGAKRDKNHRSGKIEFGRRFKEKFPGVELPQPILEQIEVLDQAELNDLETIWMFRYHTWRGYPDGMNLTLPRLDDYKVWGQLGGLATKETTGGRKRGNPQGQLNATFEGRSKGGRIVGAIYGPIQGRKNAESGQMSRVGKIYGPAQGKKLVESGVLASYRTPEHQSEACRKRNAIHGNPQTTEGSKKGACGMWNIRHGKPCTCGQHIKVIEV